MAEDRSSDEVPPPEEDDEFHSSLEIDDTSGWRVFIVPIILVILVIGMIAFFFVYEGDMEPDPRIANRLKEQQAPALQSPPPAAQAADAPAQGNQP